MSTMMRDDGTKRSAGQGSVQQASRIRSTTGRGQI